MAGGVAAITGGGAGLAVASVPIVVLLAYVPHALKAVLITKAGLRYNNVSPRDMLTAESLAKKELPAERMRYVKMARRCQAAHQNGLENFPIYAGALVFAFLAGVPTETINQTAAVYLGARFLYNFVYMLNETATLATLRSLTWTVGFGACIRLYIAAARLAL